MKPKYNFNIDLKDETNLNILVYKSYSHYIAEDVKTYNCAQGDTIEKAIESLRIQHLINPQLKYQLEKEYGKKCSPFPKAPKYFKKYFDQGKVIKKYCKYGDTVKKIGKKEVEELHGIMFK